MQSLSLSMFKKTDSVAHPASYPVSTGGFFHGSKVAEV